MRLLATLLLLLPLAACTDDDRTTSAPLPTSPTSTPASTTPTPEPEPSLADLPSGPAPRIGYVVGSTYVAPDGTRTRIPTSHHIGIQAVARLGDGLLVQRDDVFETYTTLDLVRGGRVVDTWSVRGAPVIGRHGEVAWCQATTSEAAVHPPPAVWLSTEDRRQHAPLPDDFTTVQGVLDGEVLYAQDGPFGNDPSIVRLTDLAGSTRDVRLEWVYDVDERNGRAVAPMGASSNVVVDLHSGHVLWTTLSAHLLRFSPSGRWLLTRNHRGTRYSVLDAATGAVHSRFRLPKNASVDQMTWESDRSVLLVVDQDGRSTVVRADRDGSLELALPEVRDPRGFAPGYVLELRA